MKQQMLEAEVKELKDCIETLKARLDVAHDMRTILEYRIDELVAQVDDLTAERDAPPKPVADAGAKDYAALRQDIRNMVELYEIYNGEELSLAVDLESARGALSYLDTYEGKNWPSPRILVENNSIVLTWEIGNWKLYQYCDDEPQKIFRWDGTPPARDASDEG
jgi:hypothetical protein